MVFLLGRRWSARAGIIAAALVAFNFYLIQHAHIIRPDIWQTNFILGAVIASQYIERRSRGWPGYFLLGTLFGLGVTMKYPTAFLAIAGLLFAIDLWRSGRWYGRGWLIALGTTGAAAILSGPFIFLDPIQAGRDLWWENSQAHGLHSGLGYLGNLAKYLGTYFSWQIGTGLYLVTIATAVYVFRLILRRQETARSRSIFSLFIVSLIYILSLSLLKNYWERWTIPALTLMLVVSAVGLDVLWRVIRPRWLAGALVVLVCFAPAWRLMRTISSYAQAHTTELARTWMVKHIPAGSTIAVEPYSPDMSGVYQIQPVSNLTIYSADAYRQRGVRYLVATSAVYRTIARGAERFGSQSNYGQAYQDYQVLFQQSRLLFVARPNPTGDFSTMLYAPDWTVMKTLSINLRQGPTIWIYELQP